MFSRCWRMTEPSTKEGIVSIPGSLLIRYTARWRKYIPDSSRSRRLRKGLERVCRSGGVFHVWFHPENLYAEWPRLENVVARFLEDLGTMVRDEDLRCLAMGQLATEFLTKLAVKRQELTIALRKNQSPREQADEVVAPVAAAHFPARSGHDSSCSSS